MLTTNADNSFVVLIGYMERDRRRHFLLHKVETVLCRIVLVAYNVNIEVVLVEAVKDDLNVA